MKIKKHLVQLYRGIQGIYDNTFERIPEIPANIEKFSIGDTQDNRSIDCFRIGNGSINIAFIGGIHGNEIGTVKFIKQLITFLNKNNINYPGLTFYCIPVLNPDGYQVGLQNSNYFTGGNVGRFNANGVDLNKNFPTKSFKSTSMWSRGDNFSEGKEVFAGEYGGSEKETQALISFLKDKKISILFSYHSRGRDVQGNKIEPSEDINKIYAENAGFTVWTEEQWKKLDQTGTLKEWCDENKIAICEVESTVRWGSDWKTQKNAVTAVLEYLQNNFK